MTIRNVSLSLFACVVSGFLYGEDAPSAAKTASEPSSAFPELKKQQEQLTLESSIADLQLKKALASLLAEKQRGDLEAAVAQHLRAEIGIR